jgi:tripartite ATP-independent transporter DctP family solute receptor
MKKKLMVLLMICCVLGMGFAQGNKETSVSSGEGETKKPSYSFKLGHVSAADYPVCQALKQFADKVYELSNGDIQVQVYTDGQLGQEKDALEAVKLGSMGMTSVNGGAMPAFVPEYAAFTIPYIFRDNTHKWTVLNGEIGKKVAQLCADAGFHLVSYMDEGARHVYTTKKPVSTVAALKGLKIRTTGSTASQDGFAALGASPTPINYGEVFTALQQGIVDGAENNYSSYYTSKHYEVAKYITNTGHLRVPGAFVMSEKVWKGMTPEQQKAITDAAKYACEWGINRFNEMEDQYLKKALADGATFVDFPASEVAKAQKLCQPVFDKYKKEVGADLIDGILNTK